jgi:acyl-CoA thioester hydrolase
MSHAYRTQLRVRYSETDQMGTFYNSRALDWFEVARTETLRQMGLPYRTMEDRGALLPVVEAHVQYLGRAQYDDLLQLTASPTMQGRARIRFDVAIQRDDGQAVAEGWTVHAVTDPDGKAIRPPAWLTELLTPDTE